MDTANILNELNTLEYLKNTNLSLSRFGDGEFALILGKDIHFQKYNQSIGEKLKNILINGSNEKCLIGIPPVYKFNSYDNITTKYWIRIKNKKFIQNVNKIINKDCLYGSSFISRIECFNYNIAKSKYIDNIVKLFELSKNIFIVNPNIKKILFELGFDKKLNIHDYILIPESDAFDEFDSIVGNIKKYGTEYKYCICAGPTATIISYELAQQNYVIYDLGHFFHLLNQLDMI